MLESAPYFSDVSRGPSGGHACWVSASDGVRIRVGFWPVDAAQGTVLIFPGRTEYIEKYSDAAREFAERGLASIAVDWRGQGLADRASRDGKLGHVADFGEFQLDVDATLAAVRAAGMPEPYYLLAHSMGGCIGLRALLRELPVDAVAFSAPMWGLELKPHTRIMAWIGSTLAVHSGLSLRYAPGTDAAVDPTSMPFENNPLTRDRDMFSWMQSQTSTHPELFLGGPSFGWLNAALREMRALSREKAPELPCACWLGTGERIVEAQAIHERMNAWPDGRLHIVEGAEHEVAMEGPAMRKDMFDGCNALFRTGQALP